MSYFSLIKLVMLGLVHVSFRTLDSSSELLTDRPRGGLGFTGEQSKPSCWWSSYTLKFPLCTSSFLSARSSPPPGLPLGTLEWEGAPELSSPQFSTSVKLFRFGHHKTSICDAELQKGIKRNICTVTTILCNIGNQTPGHNIQRENSCERGPVVGIFLYPCYF